MAAKALEKVAVPNTAGKKGPSLEILTSLDKDPYRMIYIGLFYAYHTVIRVITLWTVYSWLSTF